jgi:DNA-binding IclR family transcriptional regulator
MPERVTYHAAECAELLGMATVTFYRQLDTLLAQGMPAPLGSGRFRISRQAFDRWLNHPRGPGMAAARPANDIDASSPISLEEHRARLAVAYARR